MTGSWWTLWHVARAGLHHADETQACRQRGPPAARTRTRALRPPVVPGLRTFARVDGNLLRVSVRGDGRPILLIMGLGGNIEMWDPLERELHARGFQTIAYDAPGTGHSPPRLVPAATASPARLPTSWTASACPTPTCSACRSGGVAQSWPCATPTESAGWSWPPRRAGSVASPAPRWRSACSPRRCATTRPASCRRPPAGCTARSPTPTAGSCTSRSTLAGHDPRRCGLPEPALRDRGLDEPPVVAPPHRRSSSPVARTPSSHP